MPDERFITLSDLLVNRDKVLFVWVEGGDFTKTRVTFEGGVTMQIDNRDDARDLWTALATERHWRDDTT